MQLNIKNVIGLFKNQTIKNYNIVKIPRQREKKGRRRRRRREKLN